MSPGIAASAVAWYRQHSRDLPWRQTRDPYRIWVSEIMLQQTQVATVIPYYLRFLDRFPDVRGLAIAPLDEVYRYWSGLGYYRRAKQMHDAANKIITVHDAQFPEDFELISDLPGIGRYTASAIASFALDQNRPIVEANTQRLYARLMGLDAPLQTSASQFRLWEFAGTLIPKTGPGSGEINQALMDIGSQICTPRDPNCSRCPLSDWCVTAQQGAQARIPVPKPRKTYTDLTEAALVIEDNRGRWLMRRCLPNERWAGLWDFPRFDISNCKTQSSVESQLQESFRERFHRDIKIGEHFHSLKHAVTRFRITLDCFRAVIVPSSKRITSEHVKWYTSEELTELALCSSGKRLTQWLAQHRSPRTQPILFPGNAS